MPSPISMLLSVSVANATSAPSASRRYGRCHGVRRATIIAANIATTTTSCCSSETIFSCEVIAPPTALSGAVTKNEYRKPVTTARPAMSMAVVAASGSRAPRCGCASRAKSGATAPNSANTAGQASQVLRANISSSAAHPVSPIADIASPRAIVAQNSHWHPLHACRRRTITIVPVIGGTSSAAARNQPSTVA